MEPLREFVLRVPAREVESTIPAGFQSVWGDGTLPDGRKFQITVGAGFGSGWGTFRLDGDDRSFAFRAGDLVAAFAEAIDGEEGKPDAG
jgi:hypothetical protein